MTLTRIRVVCWVMLLIYPMITFAADTDPAIVRGTGTVTVNGASVPSSSSTVAYVGDHIETGKDSAAILTFKGSVVNVAPESAVDYVGNSIRLRWGKAVVSTYTRLQGNLANLIITPDSAPRVRFLMELDNCTMLVSALESSLSITDGTNTELLAQGNTLRRLARGRNMAQDQPPPPPGASRGPQRDDPCIEGAAPPPGASYKLIPGWILVVGAVGGLFGGLLAAGVFESGKPPITPSKP